MVVMLDNCCKKYDLKCGCTIIGTLCLLFSLLMLVGSPLTLSRLENELDEVYRHFGHRLTVKDRQRLHTSATVFRVVFYGQMIVALSDVICSILLIFGAQKSKPHFVLPWAIEQTALLPIYFLLVLAFTIISFIIGDVQKGAFSLFLLLIRTAVTVYFILVVYSLYRSLRGQRVPTDPSRAV